jgi:molybdate transport system substrate-binding protein
MPLFTCICLMALFSLSAPLASAEELLPPWTVPPRGGVHFTVACVNDVPDLHGDLHDPDLVIFFGGNQFMVLPEIISAFQKEYPEVEKIYFETLPPGIVEKQLKTGSLVMGNLKITAKPDLFVAGKERVKRLKEEGFLEEFKPYFRNRLAIMVGRGNPKEIHSLNDLGREEVRVAMPNREIEGIAEKIIEAYGKAGGRDLVGRILMEKVRDGTTFITQIHHRQTPMRIMLDLSDAGPVWYTEALFQKRIGNPIDLIEISDEHNVTGTAAAAIVKNAPHKKAARDFYQFLTGETAQRIYREFGFLPIGNGPENH